MIDILRTRKTTIIFISHKLEEVLRLCESVTVMRDGRKVMSCPDAEQRVDQLVTAMLGERLEKVAADRRAQRGRSKSYGHRKGALRVEGLTIPESCPTSTSPFARMK